MSVERTSIVAPGVADPLPDVFPHAVKAGDLIFVSGSIGFDENSKMVEGGIKEHTHQIIKNLTTVLETAGSSRDKIVKLNVFITNMEEFSDMNEVYCQNFKKPNLPCRTWVAVKTLPFNTDVEMECTALA